MTNPYDQNYGGGQQPAGYGSQYSGQSSQSSQPSYGQQPSYGEQQPSYGQAPYDAPPGQGQQAGQWGQPAASQYPQQQSSFGSGGQGQWGQPGDNQSAFSPPPAGGAPQWGQQAPAAPQQPSSYYPVAAPKRRNTALIVRLSILGLVVVVGVGIWAYNRSQQASVSSNGQVTKNGDLGVFSLKVGNCFNDPGQGADVASVTAIVCDQSHDAQVIGIGTLTESSADSPAVTTDANTQCQNFASSSAVDQTKVSTNAQIIYFTPDDTAWANGERTLICAINTGGPVTYSVMSG